MQKSFDASSSIVSIGVLLWVKCQLNGGSNSKWITIRSLVRSVWSDIKSITAVIVVGVGKFIHINQNNCKILFHWCVFTSDGLFLAQKLLCMQGKSYSKFFLYFIVFL